MKSSSEQQFRSARSMLERYLKEGIANAIEKVLEEHTALAETEESIVELIYNEYLIREELGESPETSEFIERFPQYADRIQRLFSIHTTLSSEQNLSRFDSDSLPAPRRLSPGDLVGPFELLSHLGSGGRGFVFKARQVELDRVIALKILKGITADDLAIKRFLVEAKATATLQHPNIVQVYESDIYENLPYIALEYVDGGTLEDQFSSGPIAGNEAAKLIAELAEAMQYAHEKGIIHRDLKPSNILLTESGTPKITDFGLAKRSQFSRSNVPQSLTESGTVLGTPSYMAPEQAEGRNREIGPMTDVYGLGVVLYELITGQVPFVGESTLDVLQSIGTMDPVAPSLLNPRVPRDLETICLKCLEKDPASRYATAAELAADLKRFLAGHSIVARPSSFLQRFSKLARRHPVTSALSAGLVIAIITVFAVISWQWNQAAIGQITQSKLRNAAEDALYSHQLALAHKEIKSSESHRAQKILDSTDLRRRHWEWEYLKQSCDTYTTLVTLGADTRGCVISSDGNLIAVMMGRWGTDEPGTFAVFDLESRKLLYQNESSYGPVMDVAFSPDGKTLATAELRFVEGGGQVTIFDARTGVQQKKILHPSSGLFGIAYHPTLPKLALACADGSVKILDLQTGDFVHQMRGHRDNCFQVAFSPDGKQVASCSRDSTARLWNTKTGAQEAVLRAQKDLRTIDYTPDGRYVVVNGYEQAIQFWDRLEQPPRHTKVHLAGEIPFSYDLTISPHGRYIEAIGDRGSRIFSFDMSVGRINFRSAEASNRPYWLTYHPQGKRVYVVDADGNLMESNTQRTNPLQRFVTASATSISVDKSSQQLAIASGASRALPGLQDFRCRLFSLSDPDAEFRFFEGAPTWGSSTAISPDGKILACGCEDGSILQWNIDSAELLSSQSFHEGKILCLKYEEESNYLISVDSEGWIAKWQGDAEQPVAKNKLNADAVVYAVLSSDANRLFVSASDGLVSQYTVRFNESEGLAEHTSRFLWQANYSGRKVQSIAQSADGRFVAVALDNSLELWSMGVTTDQPTWSVEMPLSSTTALAFHPDARRLAVADGQGGRVALYDSTNGQMVLELNARFGTDRANLKFSSDGKQLIATFAGELYVWSIATPDAENRKSISAELSRSECRTDFQWHVNQASEQIYGGLHFGAEFHARKALSILEQQSKKLEGMPALEVLTINAKCHLAKSLIDSGEVDQGIEMMNKILSECPNQYTSLHTLSLLLATYPGSAIISSESLLELTQKALELKPSESNALATSGIALMRSGKLEQAKEHLERAANIMTSWEGLVLFPLAILEARIENHQKADRLFDRGVQWMESSSSTQPIIRELHRWTAKELDR